MGVKIELEQSPDQAAPGRQRIFMADAEPLIGKFKTYSRRMDRWILFWARTNCPPYLCQSKVKGSHGMILNLNREGRWGTTAPLPNGTCRTRVLSIPWFCRPTSSSVCLVFFFLSLCLARWFWPDLMNGRHDHTTAVCVSLRSSGGLHVVQSPAGS